MEVEEGEDEDEEQDAAIDAGPLEGVSCDKEEEDIDGGGVCSVVEVS